MNQSNYMHHVQFHRPVWWLLDELYTTSDELGPNACLLNTSMLEII